MARRASDFQDEEFVEEDDNDADVVIVGAGLTGLSCAYNILSRGSGLEVLIVEANSQIAGRLLSRDYSESFYVNQSQKHVTRLVETLQLNTYSRQSVDNRKRVLYTKSGPRENLPIFYAAEVHHFLWMINDMTLDTRLNPRNISMHENAEVFAQISVEDLLRRIVCFPFARTLCRAFMYSTCAVRNLDDVSALWFLIMLNGAEGLLNRLKTTIGDDKRYFLRDGVMKIAEELLKKILLEDGKIKYADPVREILFNDDRAYVLTEQKHCFKCSFVVIAVPPPDNGRIIIKPTLPSYLWPKVFHYAPGQNVFFNVVYSESFWKDRYSGDILSTWNCKTNVNLAYEATWKPNRSVIAGYLAQPNSSHNFKKGLFETLRESFNNNEATEYLEYRECEPIRYNYFATDEQIGAGSPMSVMRPNSLSRTRCIGIPYERIYFASSEYAINWPGTVDGAIEAGEITALSILSNMRPQSLTLQEVAHEIYRHTIYFQSPFKFFVIHLLGLGLNIAIFISYLRTAYK